jgi:gas vesicle protein|tara:strand:- start:2909 stop:3997 length:1089 start_codon:yes stop_codon:yes gene_type:complete
MPAELNYKNLLNLFVDRTKSYSLDTKTRIEDLYYQNSMGLVEEFMVSRNFSFGTLGSGNRHLVGIPKDIIDRLNTYYITLKSNISAETTTIQSKLNECNPIKEEREYIKNLLDSTLEDQLGKTMSSVMNIVNSCREQQKSLTDTIDKLNLITVDSYDGQYINPGGGRVVALQLTAVTALNNLTTSYNTSGGYLDAFVTNYINNNFSKGYVGGNEYIFFSNRMCTNKSKTFTFTQNYTRELEILTTNRKSDLYDNLFKRDSEGIKGLKYSTILMFQPRIDTMLKGWLNYDCNLFGGRIERGLNRGYSILEDNLNNYYTDYKIGYVINSGNTAQTLVRNSLISRNSGVQDGKFNYKLMQQLYIS